MSESLIFTLLFGFGLFGPAVMLMTVFAIRALSPDSILNERPVYFKVVYSIFGTGILVAIITLIGIYLMSTGHSL